MKHILLPDESVVRETEMFLFSKGNSRRKGEGNSQAFSEEFQSITKWYLLKFRLLEVLLEQNLIWIEQYPINYLSHNC
jgi:hypothetical protein